MNYIDNKYKINSLCDINNILNFDSNIEILFSEDLLKKGEVESLRKAYNLFPNAFIVYSRKEIENGNIPQGLKDSEYIFILDDKSDFSPDYLLKILSGFNKKGIKCVSGKRVSKNKRAKNKFHNFAFKMEDYEKDGKEIFKYSLRNVGTNYFTN